MSETEQEKQESQKTVVAFIAGLLIGGLLVWVFSGSPETVDVEEASNNPDATQSDTVRASDDDASDAVSSSDTNAPTVTTAPAVTELPTGDGAATVNNQPAGSSVQLASATFPADEGWIGVRDYVDGQLSGLLGVARYSKEQGLVPEEIILQRATTAGNTYAIVYYSESGDRKFSLADDVQMSGVMDTFVAQ